MLGVVAFRIAQDKPWRNPALCALQVRAPPLGSVLNAGWAAQSAPDALMNGHLVCKCRHNLTFYCLPGIWPDAGVRSGGNGGVRGVAGRAPASAGQQQQLTSSAGVLRVKDLDTRHALDQRPSWASWLPPALHSTVLASLQQCQYIKGRVCTALFASCQF